MPLKKASLDIHIFEYATEHSFIKTRERKWIYSLHWAQPLIEAGYLELDESRRKSHDKPSDLYYSPTKAGIEWWIGQRCEKYEKSMREHPEYYVKWDTSTDSLLEHFESKGIGGLVTLVSSCFVG